MKYFGKYHELYFQSDILLLAGVFENFLSMYLKVYERDPARFLTAPVLAEQLSFKRNENKIRSCNGYPNVLLVQKGITPGTCHFIY